MMELRAKTLADILQDCAGLHVRLCPRQVLGARMGMLAGRLLELDLPQTDKRLLAIAETDGCLVDGLSAATGCRVGRRTLRIVDYGKVAATFVDTQTERAVRVVPNQEARTLAWQYAPEAHNRWEAQLAGYQRMPDELLLMHHPVALAQPLQVVLGQHGQPAVCQICSEEIINQREVEIEGTVMCRACAAPAYYHAKSKSPVGLPPPGVPFPDYVPCPHCGEPEVEVWCYQMLAHCHNCGQTFSHPQPLQCELHCSKRH